VSRSTQGFSRRWTFPKAIGLAKLLRVADPRSEARLCEAQHCPQFSRRPRPTRALSAGRQISAVGTKPTGFAHGSAAGHRPALLDGRFMETSLSLRACVGTMNLCGPCQRYGVPPSGGPDRLKPGHQTVGSWREREGGLVAAAEGDADVKIADAAHVLTAFATGKSYCRSRQCSG